jgi:hypothetical protein
MEHFQKILYGQEFHLRTDHSALTRIINFKNLESKLHAVYSAYTNSTLFPNIVKAGKTKMPMLPQDGTAMKNVRIFIRSIYGKIKCKYGLFQPYPQPTGILWF